MVRNLAPFVGRSIPLLGLIIFIVYLTSGKLDLRVV